MKSSVSLHVTPFSNSACARTWSENHPVTNEKLIYSFPLPFSLLDYLYSPESESRVEICPVIYGCRTNVRCVLLEYPWRIKQQTEFVRTMTSAAMLFTSLPLNDNMGLGNYRNW
jgi:hypothetical protein